mmetsp:Transcript_2448/g.4143  ORF Transcript_2448/g.4143 Transcript_2448/m.4143 type:complete len:87 (-) Transcript_2448:392-652(-)
MHYVATGSNDKQVIVWSVESGVQTRNFQTVQGAVRSLKFNRDGTMLFAGNDEGELVIFDFVQGIPIEVVQTLQSKAIWSIDVSWDD